jgi:hypothetical protein
MGIRAQLQSPGMGMPWIGSLPHLRSGAAPSEAPNSTEHPASVAVAARYSHWVYLTRVSETAEHTWL